MASPALEALLAMQEHDTKIDQLRHRRATLPDREAVAALRSERAGIEAQREQLRTQRAAAASEQESLDADIATVSERVTSLDKRLYSGEVSAVRDIQAMSDEIARLTAHRSHLEDNDLEVMETIEALDGEIAGLDAAIAAIDVRIDEAQGRIAVAEVEIDAELGTEEGARAEFASAVPPELLADYDSLRQRLGGIGAAPLNGASCGGCHLTLPATEVDRIRRASGDVVIHCDQCGRILVRRSA